MTEITDKTNRRRKLGGLMWLALGLFAFFFLSVVLQRFRPGLLDISAAQEAALLLVATGVFISACLRLETRDTSVT
ncbi:hypothetical protein HOP62_16380 [Halomonas sp. MCCC 1A17488]|uniref:Uncharacterized protein n=1 Tax=Billgrantia sulfidoxydans TaxID=2733484 RepID=A0ABX7W8F2_9GAMM|nr:MULTISPECIES: hypothetical protein [Halomonas]MCE8017656.1 hypothetical protein [Halomonas sp. MCCC 1A17488]MCG3240989.1 hypothetical protein [Halomonas sp. MCCC 1A17488]QPP48857.1 hypothetical protein I4484_16830 [Halomonas sp. SS10-MC5]QTP56186.1 hypothetical protein HNO51_16730 [Halomonas sulfidoxydans]